ncbi:MULTISPECIES: YwdI family protein [Bacillaceae]|uniref:YwdI family protein n=1 Tax=Bacillus infantis TaxID=324767 RepID=A0A5D4SPN6_9BACI|nr:MULTISPECIES: YwdI family protein [Bacillus]OXT15681.1 hypothetical protein B9K06_19920 [Bacillus sp. OG2]MCA1033333.1 YwdI family protein [Bacillus infantis]MCK6206755.1 YwdI family protein [Bacillus infantis]MDT0161449.1 YwdI family protein [Bacillus sp. AG4(2022)]MDW2876289.1 YwdI family protein [Bacillus infantis]
MQIPVGNLLAKIEKELQGAKSSSSEEMIRERVYSIKALCELLLEGEKTSSEPVRPAASYIPQPVQESVPLASIQQPRKMNMENEANGDSIFDF